MAVVIVVMVIPVAVGMPTMPVFIPPFVAVLPAAFPCFVQFMAPALGLLALVSVMLNGFMQLVIHTHDATLAIVVVSVQARSASEKQKTG